MKNRYSNSCCNHNIPTHFCRPEDLWLQVRLTSADGANTAELVFALKFHVYGHPECVIVEKKQLMQAGGNHYALLNEKDFAHGWLFCEANILEEADDNPNVRKSVKVSCNTGILLPGCGCDGHSPSACTCEDKGYTITITRVDSLPEVPQMEELSDVNYLGHVVDASLLPQAEQPSWALVGTLSAARPYFYYVAEYIPQGYSQGWNDVSQDLGTYDLTEGRDVYQTNLFTRFASYGQIDGASVTKEDVQEAGRIINAISTTKVVSMFYRPTESSFKHFGTLDCYYNENTTEFGCYLPTADGYVIARCNLQKPSTWALVNAASGAGDGTGEGATSYNQLKNRPAINNVTLAGNLRPHELGLLSIEDTYADAPDTTDYKDVF